VNRLGMKRRGAVITYVAQLPAVVPDDQVLVHNSARPSRFIGYRGFRAWLEPAPASKYLAVCPCGWASELGRHYRVSIAEGADS
jgi:hypothetical protein